MPNIKLPFEAWQMGQIDYAQWLSTHKEIRDRWRVDSWLHRKRDPKGVIPQLWSALAECIRVLEHCSPDAVQCREHETLLSKTMEELPVGGMMRKYIREGGIVAWEVYDEAEKLTGPDPLAEIVKMQVRANIGL